MKVGNKTSEKEEENTNKNKNRGIRDVLKGGGEFVSGKNVLS